LRNKWLEEKESEVEVDEDTTANVCKSGDVKIDGIRERD